MQSVAINGVKNVGKDFIFGKITERLSKLGHSTRRISMADFLKETCITEKFPDWKFNNFLREDFKLAKTNGVSVISYLELEYDDLIVKQKLELVEVFKNLSSKGFKTRLALQQFGDYYKKKTKNMFVFSDLVINNIKSDECSAMNFVINTDTRFITELLNFLLNDFILIRLKHEDLLERETNGAPHVSELELSLFNGHIGYEFNMKGTFYDKSADVWRQNEDELNASLNNIVEAITQFKGYSKSQKDDLIVLKNELSLDMNFIELTQNYLKGYLIDQSKPDSEFTLIKDEFCTKRSYYLNKINNIIKHNRN